MNNNLVIIFIVLPTTAILILLSCSLLSKDSKWTYGPMIASEISKIEIDSARGIAEFQIKSAFNSGCSEFSHVESASENNYRFVKFYQKRERDRYCTTEMVDTEIIWIADGLSPGQYKFHFWRSDSTSLDTTIVLQ